MTVNRLGALVLAALLIIAGAACGSDQARPEEQVNATSTPKQVVHTIEGATIGYSDLDALTWASNWIVRGRVVEVLPPQRFPAEMGPLGSQTPREVLDAWIYTDYVIAVDDVYRGAPRDTIVVRQSGGTIGSITVESPEDAELRVGDEWIFFLVPPDWDQPGDALWTTGVGQGYWKVAGDQAIPYSKRFPTLSRAEFGQAIATALRESPPTDSPVVPLEEAPAGPDLPSITPTQAS